MRVMDSNKLPVKPDWLTEEAVRSLREDLDRCPNPYTDDDIRKIPLDSDIDIERANAKTARDILTKYGLL